MHLIIRVRRLCWIPSIRKRNSQSFWFHQPHWLSSLNIWRITATGITVVVVVVVVIKTKSSRADNSTTSSWLAKFLLERRSVTVRVVVTWKWNESILRIIFWYENISLLRLRRRRMRHWLSLIIGVLLVITILWHTRGMIWRVLGKLRQIHFDSLSTVWAYIGLIYRGRWRCSYFFVVGWWWWCGVVVKCFLRLLGLVHWSYAII